MSKKSNTCKGSATKKSLLFIQDEFYIGSKLQAYLDSLVGEFGQDYSHFYYHVIVCALKNIWSSRGWVPIPYSFRTTFFPTVDPDRLLEAGLLHKWWFSKEDHRCNRFSLPLHIIEEINRLTLLDLEDPDCKLINAFTGRAVHPVKTTCTDKAGNRIPQIVEERIRASSNPIIFNRTRLLREFHKHSEEVAELKAQYGVEDSRYLKQLRSFTSACSSFRSINAWRPQLYQGDLYVVKPAYQAQLSGRLTQIGGGFQNIAARYQHAAFADIDGYINYDLKSSQPRILAQLMQEAGFDDSWLQAYMNLSRGKYIYAQKIESTPDTWKDALNSVMMATQVFHPDQAFKRFRSAIKYNIPADKLNALVSYFLEETNRNRTKAIQMYKSFYTSIEPFIIELQKFHQYLVEVWIPQNKKIGKSNQEYILNDCGAKLYLHKVNREGKIVRLRGMQLKAAVTAHLLQGREARYMKELAALGVETGEFKMCLDMHDGGIFQGEISTEAQSIAAERAGLKNALLEIKPFVNAYKEQEEKELSLALEINLREMFTGRSIEDLTPEDQALIQQVQVLEQWAREFGITLDPY